MSASERRKALLALRADMNSAVGAESDRRKRKQIQKDYEARIQALVDSQKANNDDDEQQPDETITNQSTTADSLQDNNDEFKFVLKETGVSKAELKKEKKEKRLKEQQAKLVEENRATDMSQVELEGIKRLLSEDHLEIFPIASDGNCLYRALEHQLKLHPDELPSKTFRELRQLAADHMETHKDDYFFFLDEEFQTSDEAFRKYLTRLRDSDEWGGELEIKLISDGLAVPIRVYTNKERIEYVPSTTSASPPRLNISFHRHMMASAHYNSLKRC